MLIQYLLVITLVAALVFTWQRVRQGALGRSAAALWSLLWIASVLIITRPEFSSTVASWLGVGRGVDAIIYVAIAGLYYLVFQVFLKLDKLERDLTKIVRRIALDEADIGKPSREKHD
jgi:small membrane protein